MSLFVDTSVWLLAFRRDAPEPSPQFSALEAALTGGDAVLTTGLVLQELLHAFAGPKARAQILDRFTAVPLLIPDRDDHIEAATSATPAAVPESKSVRLMRSSRNSVFGTLSRYSALIRTSKISRGMFHLRCGVPDRDERLDQSRATDQSSSAISTPSPSTADVGVPFALSFLDLLQGGTTPIGCGLRARVAAPN